jgi:hypothetical protein
MGEKINYCTPDTQNQERSSGWSLSFINGISNSAGR